MRRERRGEEGREEGARGMPGSFKSILKKMLFQVPPPQKFLSLFCSTTTRGPSLQHISF